MWTSLTLHFASMVDCVILQKLHCIHNMAYIYQRWTLLFCDKFPVVWTFLCCEAYPKEVGPFDHMCLGTKRWWWVRASMKIDPSKRLPEHTRPKFAMLERVALPLASMTPYVYVPQAGCVCVSQTLFQRALSISSFRLSGGGVGRSKKTCFSAGGGSGNISLPLTKTLMYSWWYPLGRQWTYLQTFQWQATCDGNCVVVPLFGFVFLKLLLPTLSTCMRITVTFWFSNWFNSGVNQVFPLWFVPQTLLTEYKHSGFLFQILKHMAYGKPYFSHLRHAFPKSQMQYENFVYVTYQVCCHTLLNPAPFLR